MNPEQTTQSDTSMRLDISINTVDCDFANVEKPCEHACVLFYYNILYFLCEHLANTSLRHFHKNFIE